MGLDKTAFLLYIKDMNEIKYKKLWKIVRSRPGDMKRDEFQKLEKEFRVSAPKCNEKRECNICVNKNLCWF
jgi:hypothetical protein